nr:SH3 domain-containing protein [Marivivens aquimaris]
MRPMMRPIATLIALMLAVSVHAEDAPSSVPEPQELGEVTNLPLPRFVSLKAQEANVRRGPSTDYRIDWVFTRRDMPLQVTAEHGHWRRVIDRDGMGGWVHYIMLSGSRTVIIDEMTPLFSMPDEDATQEAQLESGVVARIRECNVDWCKLSAGGFTGWSPKTNLWGVGETEVID